MTITILGTNHLMSKEEIYELIKKSKPQVIAVELCQTRYDLMVLPIINNVPLVESVNNTDNGLISQISNAVRDKVKKENLQYGSDQINSCIYAVENKIPLEFVDLDIMRTKELMDKIPQSEKEGFFKELIEFQNKPITELVKDVDEEEILKKLKVMYPIAYEFLITIRDLYLLSSVLKLEKKYHNKRILVIVGKGHKKFLEENLK
jgi:pheromone shutdown protein TraB